MSTDMGDGFTAYMIEHGVPPDPGLGEQVRPFDETFSAVSLLAETFNLPRPAAGFDDPDAYEMEDLENATGSVAEVMAEVRRLVADEIDFNALFDRYIADNQKPWAHDRDKWLGASEVFGCIRKAWFKRNGAERDPDYTESWGATRRGDLIENFHVVPAMMHGLAALHPGTEYLFGGEDQRTLFHPDLPLSATPDGLLLNLARNALVKYGVEDIESDCIVFEIKSIDPRVNLAEEKAIHHGQTQIQLGLFRETTPYKPVYSVVFYVNASFLDDTKTFVVKWNPEVYEAAKARAKAVFSVTDPLKLVPEGRIEGGCEYCPFQGACNGKTLGGVPPRTPARKHSETAPELQELLGDLVRRMKKAAKAEANAASEKGTAREEIKMLLRQAGRDRASGDGWKISYAASAGRATLDKAAMEADGIDLSKYEKMGNGFENLRISSEEPDE